MKKPLYQHLEKILKFQIIVLPFLLIFGFFVGSPAPPSPFLFGPHPLINFPDFVLQIFQRLLKRIVLNKEPQKQRVNEMEQEEQEDEYINAFDFLNNF